MFKYGFARSRARNNGVASSLPAAPDIDQTSPLTNATDGSAYSNQLTTTGGLTPITYAVTSGALPSGITLSSTGLLAGTHSGVAQFTFTVTATDGIGRTNAVAFTLDVVAAGMPTANLTALYYGQDDTDFTFSAGDSIAVWKEHDGRGAGDLDFASVSGTRAVKTATHPVNTTGETVDTNNAAGDYQTPAGGTLADYFPSGVGTMYLKFYFTTHVDASNAPDWIFQASTDFAVSVRDGTQGKLHVQVNAVLEVFSLDITQAGWYTVAIRSDTGVNKLKIKVNAQAEQTAAGAVIATLTSRPKLFYDSADAGRLNGSVALMAFYSTVHDDATVASTMATIDSLLAT